MLKHRIIPVLQFDGSQAVKTTKFSRPARPVGSMMQHIMNMERRDIDEMVIIDINATRENRRPHYNKLEKWTEVLFCPVTYGGGISDLQDIRAALNAGADKVIIKTHTKIIKEAIQKFGAQCIVYAVDVNDPLGSMIDTDVQPGEIMLTDCSREGTRTGYGLSYIGWARKYWQCPLVINGGCGMPHHMFQALRAGADAVAASSMFLFMDITPKHCARYLFEQGVPVRL